MTRPPLVANDRGRGGDSRSSQHHSRKTGSQNYSTVVAIPSDEPHPIQNKLPTNLILREPMSTRAPMPDTSSYQRSPFCRAYRTMPSSSCINKPRTDSTPSIRFWPTPLSRLTSPTI